ncbi:uncharacterized protein LOC132803577 [Ziziphus jujuba]|uniref:Uncharacterized protein LOC132803577 n=1 Tax=Ziziphus jujuba TaxID=326968 RepID=A0ABM4A7U4_ZIZJJ|nr:uncharacterized protein LOC132803577 [Ziziphus jujuba]
MGLLISFPPHRDHIIIEIVTLGKIDLLLHISNVLKIKVRSDPCYASQFLAINLGMAGTLANHASSERDYIQCNQPLVSCHPWFFSDFHKGILRDKPNESLESVERFHKYIYSVSYSDHSCFYEIEQFIKLVQPLNVIGIVLSSSCYNGPLYYFDRPVELTN